MDTRISQYENTNAIVRSAIRDTRTSSVQARIRITRIERDIEKLLRMKSDSPDAATEKQIELRLRQHIQLREQVLRGLVSDENHLQVLLQMERNGLSRCQNMPGPDANNQLAPTGSETSVSELQREST
ncbi:MAG: hypothetical protein AB8B48_02435 [Pseudomonadales bacterium]